MEEDAIQLAVERAQDRRIATVEHLKTIQDNGYKFPVSTVREYYEAAVCRKDNAVSKLINDGREPLLVSMDGIDFGMHPFIETYDIMIQTQKHQGAEMIGIEFLKGTLLVPNDAIVMWR